MDPDTTDDATYHAARAALYGAIAPVFQYPDEELLADLSGRQVRERLREAAATVGLTEDLEPLFEALDSTDLETLRLAYDGLFGLPADEGTYAVVPYEAHYTTRDDVGAEQRRIATVVGLYEEVGLEPADGFDERQDHVAAELELAQVLAAQRAVAAEEGDATAERRIEAAEATTLDEHLVAFVPSLAHDLRGAAEHPVYLAAADFAEDLVTYDNGKHPDVDVDVDHSGAVAGGESP